MLVALISLSGLIGYSIWKTEEVSYAQAIEIIDAGRVTEAVIEGETLTLTPKESHTENADMTGKVWEAKILEGSQRMEEALVTASVDYDVETPSWLASNIFTILLCVWMLFLIGTMFGKGKDNPFNFIRHKGKRAENVNTTFKDVAGYDSVKGQLTEVVAFLKDPKSFSRLGAQVPRGVLMHGPPGTGKTLMARAVAGEAGVPFIAISGSDFVEMFVGVGAGRMGSLFDEARKHERCIIFIDEIDAVGKHRSKRGSGGDSERDQTINKLLAEMDGFEKETGIIVIAATNHLDSLDAALLRRFDRKVFVGLPSVHVREEILKIHARGKTVGRIDYLQVAKLTSGMSGSALRDLFNEAALLATREKAEKILTDHLIRSIELVVVGHPDTARRLSDKDRMAVAVHEAGHAIARAAMGGRERIVRVSIIPSSVGALGYNLVSPEDEADALLREAPELLGEIIVLLAGRAAEREMVGQVSTGATDDLRRANKIAYDYVTHYGFEEKLKNRALYANETRWSQDTSRKVDEAIERILADCYKQAKQIIDENKPLMGRFIGELLEVEELSGGSLQDNLRNVQPLADMAEALCA